MKNRLLIFALYILLPIFVYSQQDPKFSQNMFNQMSINPGYAGSTDMICMTAINRQQWMGFDGAPMTSIFNANAPFGLFGGNHGAGISVFEDQLGYNNDIAFSLSYSYRMKAGDGTLGIGISGGMRNFKFSGGDWSTADIPTMTAPADDPAVPVMGVSNYSYNIGFGLFYTTENMYLGLSGTNLNNPKVNDAISPTHYSRHFYLSSGYNIQLTNPKFELIPAIFIEFDGAESNININTNLLYNKKFWGGVSYNADNTVTVMAGLEIFGGVRAGYAYDIVTSSINKYSGGTHEFMLGYCFSIKKEKNPQKYKSIRFL